MEIHAQSFLGKEIEIACNGQYKYKVTDSFPLLIQEIPCFSQLQYVCCKCFETHGGHVPENLGKGKRDDNYTVVTENNENFKILLLDQFVFILHKILSAHKYSQPSLNAHSL